MFEIEIEDKHRTSSIIKGIRRKFVLDCMESNSQSQGKGPITNKPSNSYLFTFLHLEIEKLPPCVGDIWVPTLLINYKYRFVKIFIPGMEKWLLK
jgi:hypothetical protein